MRDLFESSGYSVLSYSSVEEFRTGIPKDFKGIFLVDWNLPGEKGISLVKILRLEDKVSPIFMISAYNSEEDIIEGLRSGADDYICKPFNSSELLARVANSLKKFSHISESISQEKIQILAEANSFIMDGVTVSLTAREFTIFNILFENSEQPVSREQLIEGFSNDEKMTSRNIDVHVFSLRKKIKLANLIIKTVWGTGYKLSEF